MVKELKHIAIVCNPKAGNGNALLVAKKVAAILKSSAISHTAYYKNWPETFDNVDQVWIIGGDGTLNYFINQYPAIETPLTIFKGGTGNDFHQSLYGAINIQNQADHVLNGQPHSVDAAFCNGKLFLNGVGIGFDGAIVKDLIAKGKRSGKAAYLYSILKNILFYKEKECLVKFEGSEWSAPCFMINIMNGKSLGGGFVVAPEASLNDGKLDLNIVKEIAPLKRLYYVPVIKKGNHIDLPFIKYHQVDKVEILSPQLLPAHIDGEYFSSDHFVIECLPGKYSFIW